MDAKPGQVQFFFGFFFTFSNIYLYIQYQVYKCKYPESIVKSIRNYREVIAVWSLSHTPSITQWTLRAQVRHRFTHEKLEKHLKAESDSERNLQSRNAPKGKRGQRESR